MVILLNTSAALDASCLAELLVQAQERLTGYACQLFADCLHPSACSPRGTGQSHFIVFAENNLAAAEKQRIANALFAAASAVPGVAEAGQVAVIFRLLPPDAISVNGRFLSETPIES